MMTVRLHARKTSVAEIAGGEAHEFYALHHRQKSNPRLAIRSLGLFHGDDLVAAISFCAPRTARMERNYSLELYRLCFKTGVRVSGGASKLISSFIRLHRPSDFFTYQDMAGDQSAVYEKSGMRLVSQSKIKQYLLAPGKTLSTAEWGCGEIFTMAEAVRRGPDALLGTSLGEVIRPDGSRKANPDLFQDELGWHIEETPGDRIYEWLNAELTYYTYRITASDSEKYYYGVSHVKRSGATVEECLNDGYMGSGGRKFQNWKLRHSGSLVKEILGVHSRKSKAYLQEAKLVGESYRDDPLCLNSSTGGLKRISYASTPVAIELKECSIHGETKHRGDFCCSCMVAERTSLKFCPIHGESKHQGNSCYSCSSEATTLIGACEKHGESKFNGQQCMKCVAEDSISTKSCEIHGDTLFRGDSCSKCLADSKNSLKECPVHGLSKHQGSTCYSCMAEAMTSIKYCEKHGDTKFRGKSCQKCSSEKKEATNSIRRLEREQARLIEYGSIADAEYFESWSESNTEDPTAIQAKSSAIFKWWCDQGEERHEYEKSAYDRARGRNCPHCARRKRPIRAQGEPALNRN